MTQPIPREVAHGVPMSPALTAFLNLNNPNSAFGKVFSGINISIADLETANATLQADIDTNADGIADNTALISSNYTALANADSALATRTLTLETSVNHPTTGLSTKAAISYVDSATSTLEGSIASTETTLRTEYQNADTTLQGTLQADIDTRATITQLNTVESNLNGSIATSETTLRAEFAAADTALETGLQTNIDAKASITYVDTADASLSGAISTSETTLRAEYQAADATLQTGIDNNAADIVTTQASVTTEATARADGDNANAALITALDAAYQSADSTLQSDIATKASITYVDTADASLSAAQATSETTLRAEYQAGDSATAVRLDNRANAAGGLLPNWNFAELDSEDKPAGIREIESTTNRSRLYVPTSGGMGINGAGDATLAFGFPAIPIDHKKQYRVTIRHESTASSTNGLYLRMQELNAALQSGQTHIGLSSSGAHLADRTSFVNFVSDGPMPGTSIVEDTYLYTPTAGTRFASFSMYSWSAFTGNYEVESVQINDTSEALEGRVTTTEAGIVTNATAIANETGARASQDTAITAAYQSADSTLQGNIDTEEAARISGDNALDTRVTSTEASVVTNASAIASESSSRASQDTAITAAYQAGDTTLQGNIDAEEAARIAGDAGLQTDVNARATITYVDAADASLSGALATSETTLRADAARTVRNNLLKDTRFLFGNVFWGDQYQNTGLPDASTYTDYAGGARVWRRTFTGTPTDYSQVNFGNNFDGYRVTPGDYLEAQVRVKAYRFHRARIGVLFYDAANASLGYQWSNWVSYPDSGNWDDETNLPTLIAFKVQAPANAYRAIITVIGNTMALSNPWMEIGEPYLGQALDLTSAFAPFTHGDNSEDGADVTATSAAFTSEQSTRASEDAALAAADTALQASIDGVSASVTTNASAIADIEGNLEARYAVSVDGGGNGAFVSLEDGTSTPSTITMAANDIKIEGDVIVDGGIATTAYKDQRDNIGGYQILSVGTSDTSLGSVTTTARGNPMEVRVSGSLLLERGSGAAGQISVYFSVEKNGTDYAGSEAVAKMELNSYDNVILPFFLERRIAGSSSGTDTFEVLALYVDETTTGSVKIRNANLTAIERVSGPETFSNQGYLNGTLYTPT